ncbi:L-histidine N(alpha)-methyltransferase [Streptomyces sp. NPDC004376]
MSPFMITRFLPDEAADAALRAEILRGLTRAPKTLPAKWLYDAHRSELFQRLTELPEHYPAHAERELLIASAADIAEATGARTLIELGSGSSEKTRYLLDALPDLDTYVPVDVSESTLTQTGHTLVEQRPGLNVHALLADFTTGLALPGTPGPHLLAFLGSTIGNFLPRKRATLLSSIRSLLSPGDALLLGIDLVKDERSLIAAYDDATGVTAAFNKNVLSVLNRVLGADFDLGVFEHVIRWDAANEGIEMRLRSRTDQTVKIPALGLTVDFAAGEEIRTEVSAKFREPVVRRELTLWGLEVTRWWTAAQLYGLALARPSTPPVAARADAASHRSWANDGTS